MATLQDLFLLALGPWLVARQPPCLVRHQQLCAVEGLPYQVCAWVICCVDKSGEGNKRKAAQTGSAVVLGVCVAAERICAAAHIRSYAESMNMQSSYH
jgi:hypothetical protein